MDDFDGLVSALEDDDCRLKSGSVIVEISDAGVDISNDDDEIGKFLF